MYETSSLKLSPNLIPVDANIICRLIQQKTILTTLVSSQTIQSTQEAQEAPIPGYGVQDISWEAVLSPNGPAIRHLGTREEFLDKLLEADPTADRSDIYGGFAGRTRAPPDAGLSDQDSHGNSTNGTDTGLTKRDCPHYCFNYPETRCEYIQRGIDYLRHVPFQPTNGPGPGNCGRVNCSWNSAIWWCNDVSALPCLLLHINMA